METSRPKTPVNEERIRAALRSVRGSTEVSQAGPAYGGLSAEAPIVIASFFDRSGARVFQQRLLDCGVMSTLKRSRGKSEVLVALSDRVRSDEVLSVHLASFPDVRRFSIRRPLDYTLLAGGLSFAFAMIYLAGKAETALIHRLQIGGLVIGLGLLIGGMLDLSLGRYYRKGAFQFGIGTLLLLTAAVALVLFLVRMLIVLGL